MPVSYQKMSFLYHSDFHALPGNGEHSGIKS